MLECNFRLSFTYLPYPSIRHRRGEAIQNDSSFLSGNNVGIEKKSLFPVGCFALFFLFLGRDEDDDGKLCGEKLIAFSRMRNQSLAIDCEYSIILIGICRTNMYVS